MIADGKFHRPSHLLRLDGAIASFAFVVQPVAPRLPIPPRRIYCDFHAAAFSHPTNRLTSLSGGVTYCHLSSSREALQKEEAKPSTMPAARRSAMKNLFSPALYITVSFVSQYLKTTIYSFSLTTPAQNTTPTFSPTPHLQHSHHQIHYSQMAKQWLN